MLLVNSVKGVKMSNIWLHVFFFEIMQEILWYTQITKWNLPMPAR